LTNLKNKTIKRAISKEDILKLINYDAEVGTYRYDAIKMFTFMYLTYGLNFADLSKLKESNLMVLKETYILTYNRSKGGKLYEIPLSEIPINILNYYYALRDETGYLFPVLHKDIHISPTQVKTRIKTALKKFNAEIKLVAQELMIQEKVTSYVSRHTFASVLAKEGESLYTISEMMGHSDLKTTQVYLKELDYSGKIAAGRKLLE
jgi:site-specific recombinase XerD